MALVVEGVSTAYAESVATFEQFDEDGDGVISREELAKVFSAIDPERWTERRLQLLMDVADTNGDGHIHYEEFVKWLMTDSSEWNVDRTAVTLRKRSSFRRQQLVMDSRQTVRRTEPVRLQADQSEGRKLGVTVDSSDGRTLLIKSIKSDGILSEWNSGNRTRQINPGDRIVEVNDLRGDANRLMKELKKRLVIDVVVAPREDAKSYVNAITDVYDLESGWLEEGSFSCIKWATHKASQAVYAVKCVHQQSTSREEFETMTGILKELDHPNILKLFEVFEDCIDFQLVTEVCAGGELFERVLRDSFFTERQAACVMLQILAGVGYLHSRGICHRNLRPEHVLLEDDKPIVNCVVKLIDFRAARRFEEGMHFKTCVGQALYIPPEMARRRAYDHSCDLWSCGVMLYLAISGYPPFVGENDGETLRMVQRADLVFPEGDWKNVSPAAKDLVGRLLSYRPGDRPSAVQAANHEWIKNSDLEGSPFPLHQGQAQLHAYCGTSKLKKAALHAIARRLRNEDIQELYDMFALLDKNGDKLVTFYELKEGLDKLGKAESLETLKTVMEEVDVDGSRQIDYTEFLAATLDRKRYHKDAACWEAFQVFDRDKSGRISRQELAKVLATDEIQAVVEHEVIEGILQDCDADQDGEIDFQEFVSMMRRGDALEPEDL